jgi:hypothetical protein
MDKVVARFDASHSAQLARRSTAALDAARNITVVFTSEAGTIAALRSAADLSVRLDARVTLAILDVVPYGRPLNEPTDMLERRSLRVVADSGVRGTEIRIQIWRCRDMRKGLRQILTSHSMIVLGGRVSWWPSPERKLQRWLSGMGHHVILADVRAEACRRMLPASQRQAVLGRTLRAMHE